MEPETSKERPKRKKVPPPVPKKKSRAKKPEPQQVQEQITQDFENDQFTVKEEEFVKCEDLTRLPFLYDDLVLQCISLRFSAGQYYTWAGPTLVALNPCKNIPHLYTSDIRQHHYSQIKSGKDKRDAHVYSIAGVAHHHLLHQLGCVNQAILVSGESGAGKTMSARYMLGYLTQAETGWRSPSKTMNPDGGKPETIQERILASNPILEAFGNAATLRNHNSSRFGKLLRLQYGGGVLRGAEIETYLLEKFRVTHQPENERNFHIFYQVVAGVHTGAIEGLLIEPKDQFRILPGQHEAENLDNFYLTYEAFQQLGFPKELQHEIFKVISALLHMGNVTFTKGNGNQETWEVDHRNEKCRRSLNTACELLGLEVKKLEDTLTVQTITVGAGRKVSVFHKPCSRQGQCEERRDALMQLLYQSLFNSIVSFFNAQVCARRDCWENYLGILDIYGFETFEHNSLEQLCINYANERLQQEFITRYLATEHMVLLEEGLLDLNLTYSDNAACVAALDSHVSVFAILNEECQLKRIVKEEEACERVVKALEDTGVVYPPSSPRHTAGFVVRHYAGPVSYSAQGLLYKNKDEVPHEISSLLIGSESSYVADLVLDDSEGDFNSSTLSLSSNSLTGTPRRTTRKITTLSKFKSSLDALMRSLTVCDLHYVRCLKPNVSGIKDDPDPAYLLHQLHACGIIETVQISQAGYPVRVSYREFVKRYGKPGTGDDQNETERIATEALCDGEAISSDQCRFGKSIIFLSENAFHILERVRKKKRENATICLQKYFRRWKYRREFLQLKSATLFLQHISKGWLIKRKFTAMKSASLIIQKNTRKWLAQKKFRATKHAILTIQKYIKGMNARKRYESLKQKNLRPSSRYSTFSAYSSGHYSMSTSVSDFSLGATSVTSPSDLHSFDMALMYGINGPASRQSFLETEESGIETDTESINEDTGEPKPKVLKKRAQLMKILQQSQWRNTRVEEVASEESDVDSSDRGDREVTSDDQSSPERTMLERKYSAMNEGQKLKVTTVCGLKDASGVLKKCSPENLQLNVADRNVSLFFKDGVLSYRRIPMVAIKFHTRRTCLPYSYHMPFQELPQGFLDAFN
ncbi:unconventional myosin-XIX-like isoform X2 [Oratosquilla oratoria]|uniref:unconventional myosin-XIX-like isoform X2 n=1 Tax=Oratosquilla oratoria TaxID=337810 RepID=UPI003F760409